MHTERSQTTIMILAGGTGGHVYPALAVATELSARGYDVQWLGTPRGLEQRVVPEAGFTLHQLQVRGVRGKGLFSGLLGVATMFVGLLQALRILLKVGPGCALGMGGYVAGPAGLATWLLRRPLLLHEQNAVAGTTNRLLAPFATRIFTGFPGAFGESQAVTVTGNPVRRELLSRGGEASYQYDGERALRLLVLGGSLGARPINDVVPEAISRVAVGCGVEVWHQTGDIHIDAVRELYDQKELTACKVDPFIEDMASAYAWADLVLCRAGALTVTELTIMGRPSILVPLPYAIDDHQTANARSLTEVDAGLVLPQSELDPRSLASLLSELVVSPARLCAMAAAALSAARPDAAVVVADACQEVCCAG